MRIYLNKRGSNQFKKVKKTPTFGPALAFVSGAFLLAGMVIPLGPDSNTKLLQQFEFGRYPALVVAADVKLIEKPTATPKVNQTVVAKGIKTEIYEYLIKVFGDHAGDAIAMIRVCENGTFAPDRMSPVNIHKDGRRTVDVGVMQINVDVNDTAEIEKLKSYKYNIDRGYQKWLAGDGKKHRKTFYLWTCANAIGQYNYVDAMNGR